MLIMMFHYLSQREFAQKESCLITIPICALCCFNCANLPSPIYVLLYDVFQNSHSQFYQCIGPIGALVQDSHKFRHRPWSLHCNNVLYIQLQFGEKTSCAKLGSKYSLILLHDPYKIRTNSVIVHGSVQIYSQVGTQILFNAPTLGTQTYSCKIRTNTHVFFIRNCFIRNQYPNFFRVKKPSTHVPSS